MNLKRMIFLLIVFFIVLNILPASAESAWKWNAIGQILYEQGRYDEAIYCYDNASSN